MNRLRNLARSAARNKLAVAAALAIGAFVARDPWVGGLVASARGHLADAIGRRDRAEADGYLRFAEMVQAREAAERARRDYNEGEPTLKGDALLEAQDRLRAAKARDRQARLAFYPELARRCRSADVPLPRVAVLALEDLSREAGD